MSSSDEEIAREIQADFTEKGIRGIAMRSQIGGIIICVPKEADLTPAQSAYIRQVVGHQQRSGRRVDFSHFD